MFTHGVVSNFNFILYVFLTSLIATLIRIILIEATGFVLHVSRFCVFFFFLTSFADLFWCVGFVLSFIAAM